MRVTRNSPTFLDSRGHSKSMLPSPGTKFEPCCAETAKLITKISQTLRWQVTIFHWATCNRRNPWALDQIHSVSSISKLRSLKRRGTKASPLLRRFADGQIELLSLEKMLKRFPTNVVWCWRYLKRWHPTEMCPIRSKLLLMGPHGSNVLSRSRLPFPNAMSK